MDEKIASIDLSQARLPVKTEVVSLLEQSQQKQLLEINSNLNQEINSLKQRHDNASLFGRAVAFLDRDENKRIEKLQDLEARSWSLLYSQSKPNLRELNGFTNEARQTLEKDKSATWIIDSTRQLLSGAAWTASCFMKGRMPVVGNFVLGAVEAPINTAPGSTQIAPLRILAGGTQSAVARYGVNKIAGVSPTVRWQETNNNFIMKTAVGGGLIYRASYGVSDQLCNAIETTVNKQDFANSASSSKVRNGSGSNFDIVSGTRQLFHQVFNPTNIGIDLLVGGVNRKLSQESTRFLPAPLANNPYLATRMSATTFGVSSGAFNEINRQSATGEQFDPGRVIFMSLANGFVGAFASIPGARQVQVESHKIHRDSKIQLPNYAEIPHAVQEIKTYSRSEVKVPKAVTGQDSIFIKQDMMPKEMLKIRLSPSNSVVAPLSYEKHMQNVQIKKGEIVPGVFDSTDSLSKSARTISRSLGELNKSYQTNKILPETIAYQQSFLPNPAGIKHTVLLPGFDKHGLNNFNENAVNSTMFIDPKNKTMYVYLKERTYTYGKGEKINDNTISVYDVTQAWSRLTLADKKYASQSSLLEAAAKRDAVAKSPLQSGIKAAEKKLYTDEDELSRRDFDHAAEALLVSDARTFLRFVHNNPTQAALWSGIIEQELKLGQGFCKNEQQLRSRVEHIKTYIVPQVQNRLGHEIVSATRPLAKASPESISLLGCLGDKSHLEALKAVAGIKYGGSDKARDANKYGGASSGNGAGKDGGGDKSNGAGKGNDRPLKALISINEIVKRENVTDPKQLSSCIATASKVGNSYMQNKEYAKALRSAKEMLDLVQRLPQAQSSTRESLASAHELMAMSYRKMGKTQKAIEHYVEAQKVNESLYGLNSPKVADNLWQLSKIYNLNDVMCESLKISSIECLAKSPKPSSEMLAWRQGELAKFYFSRSKFAQALPLYEQSIKVLSGKYSDKNIEFAQMKTFRDCSREQLEKSAGH